MAHEKIALRCSAYLWGIATLGKVAGEVRMNSGGCCYEGHNGTPNWYVGVPLYPYIIAV